VRNRSQVDPATAETTFDRLRRRRPAQHHLTSASVRKRHRVLAANPSAMHWYYACCAGWFVPAHAGNTLMAWLQ